ncbi:hypothetical protein BJ912DRAFT_1052647 [Pholiota molesta]|nr:hypothetical protein BJ912DRAFT_1052647 [Pholiota molesta]
MAGVLLILIVLSLTRPEALHRYIGAKAPPTSATAPAASTPTTAISSNHAGHTQANVHVLSYENYTKFPLQGHEYRAECAKLFSGYMTHGDYWDNDPMGSFDVPHGDDTAVCSSTITYMLDGTVGLTADLAIMAQAAALARERNRTFFVDDTHWNRGKWLDHFDDVTLRQPGPQPKCKAPPPEGTSLPVASFANFSDRYAILELVACPRTARHWVISARTAKYHFAHGFSNHYENAYGHNLNRLKPIFNSALDSFKSTIRPNIDVQGLIRLARNELYDFLGEVSERDEAANSIYVGTHVRRGDRKSLSYTYKDRKIPLSEYLSAITATWTRLHPGPQSRNAPVVYLATDSPEARQKFGELYEGETFSLFDTADPALRALASPREYNQTQFDELSVQSRITATKGMLVDLALVSGLWANEKDMVPDATICALSSTVCRLTPIGLGWERAFGKVNEMGDLDAQGKRWIDVDEKGLIVPVWQAFQLFN